MTLTQREALLKAFRYWLCSYAIVAGFLFYQVSAPPVPLILAGLLSLAATLAWGFWRA